MYVRIMKSERINFRISPEQRAGLLRVREQYDMSEAEQIRQGIWMWLASKGVRPMVPKQVGGRKKR
jgi:hypothetical protein